jgi:hypothetical protein
MENIDYVEKLLGKWGNGYSIIKLIVFIVLVYFLGLNFLLGNKFDKLSIINLIILGTVILFLVIFWYITTKRLPIRFDNKIQFAILINTDDDKINAEMKSIIEDCIHNINDLLDISKVILLPFNYKRSELEIKQFLDTRGFSIETLLLLKLNSGNYVTKKISSEKMTINEIKCYSKVEINKNKKIYNGDVNLIPDIKLTNYHKNWDYLNAHSCADKIKYKTNLKDLILQYIAIYYIYLDEFEASLNILTRINHDKVDSINPIKNNFKISRFNNIILELLFKLSLDYYYKNKDYKSCYNLMIKSINLIGDNHIMSFDCYINLAITSYRLDDIVNAKIYTQKAKLKQSNSSMILINEAFFSIIDNDPITLSKKYKLLQLRFSILKETNVLEVIEFISGEKFKYVNEENHILFEFAEGFLIRHYTDQNFGIMLLQEFIIKFTNSNNFNQELLELANNSISIKKKLKINYRKAS